MRALLMYPDRDFHIDAPPPAQAQALREDLDLDTLIAAMAMGDHYLSDVATTALMSSLTDPDTIGYRQQILHDCLAQPNIVRRIYALTVSTLAAARKIVYHGVLSDYPEGILRRSIEALEIYVASLAELRHTADEYADQFRAPAMVNLFTMLTDQLDDAYLDTVRAHLRTLKFRRGLTMSADLGSGNKGVHYTLRTPPDRGTWLTRLTDHQPARYSFTIPERDEAGFRALAELRGRGVDQAANAVAQSTDHIGEFFAMLRTDLGFYIGCLNLADRLATIGTPICTPTPAPADQPAWTGRDLYDVCLALRIGASIVANNLHADTTPLVMITGANRGGKSTFLRSIGLAQLMMQAGMYAAATRLHATVCTGLYTHFKREEDATMQSGKLDEELRRMSGLADILTPGAVMLFNESFAATNEREGSTIARHVIDALTDSGIRVFFVTHLYDLATELYRDHTSSLFLRAERGDTGARSFKLLPGEPLSTSFGGDVYDHVFTTTGGRRKPPPGDARRAS